ncbi:MAG: SirB2 family protein [Pseudomonadota bacterium]
MGLLKALHIGCVALSFTGYLVRGIWMLRDSPRLRARWVRVVPHIYRYAAAGLGHRAHHPPPAVPVCA